MKLFKSHKSFDLPVLNAVQGVVKKVMVKILCVCLFVRELLNILFSRIKTNLLNDQYLSVCAGFVRISNMLGQKMSANGEYHVYVC